MINKKWYKSKTVWANAISIVIIGLQATTGYIIVPLEIQGAIVAALNVILRSITSTNITT